MTATLSGPIASELALRRARLTVADRAKQAAADLDLAEREILTDSNKPASVERWIRLSRAYWARGAAWRSLADATSDDLTARAMTLAGNADAERARRMMRQLRIIR